MSTEPVSSELRAVLSAPRGHRFSRTRTGTRPPTREQRLLAQMAGNPRVAYRQAHGQLPPWMVVHAARLAEGDHHSPRDFEGPWKPARSPRRAPVPMVPRPRSAPDDGPPPPRPPRPPLPRRPRRPHSHRKPRRKPCWSGRLCILAGYTLATAAGALAHHVATLLL